MQMCLTLARNANRRPWKAHATLLATLLLTTAAGLHGGQQQPLQPLRVDLNPDTDRSDVRTPNWENWRWRPGQSGSMKFGAVTVTFRSPSGATIADFWYKPLLLHGATMGADGIAVKDKGTDGQIEMVLEGLSASRHTVVTYHNEVRDIKPAKYDIYVNDVLKIKGFVPTHRATNDYDVASVFLEIDAAAGKAVIVRFCPDDSGTFRTCMINGFEIDTVDPRKKAIKPHPPMDDEHVDPEAALEWTAAKGAVSHHLYLGEDAAAVAKATPSAPEYKGDLKATRYPLPRLDHMKTYWWRVDEVHAGQAPVKGEVWRFRMRHLAFPTAEGYGRFARGGRGGRVIEVTNLQDYDTAKGDAVIAGSLRAAVEASGPRTVIFRVSGVIFLKRPLTVKNSYLTVAGQTAPGDGICLANYSFGILGCHDVIIRYIRVRVGDHGKKAMDGMGAGGGANDCIFDHCSISWTLDEGFASRGARNITFQRNIISEALHHSYHYYSKDRTKFETHAFAASISGNIGSFHHNLLAHCTDRNWSLAGGYNLAVEYDGFLDIRNNVVYNWIKRTTDGGVMRCNYVNNYYKPYPKNPHVKWLLKLDPIDQARGLPKYYMTGNVMEGLDFDNDNWKAFVNGADVEKLVRVDKPLFEAYVTTQSAREAYKDVLKNVGARFPKQDVIDSRIIDEARNGTVHYTGTKGPKYDRPSPNYPGIIDTQEDVLDAKGSPHFPWPDYRTGEVPLDSDHDGIPDWWEKKFGLNPNDPADANQRRDGTGYTNLEVYLGWLVGDFPNPKNK
jgi:hypothetical protein